MKIGSFTTLLLTLPFVFALASCGSSGDDDITGGDKIEFSAPSNFSAVTVDGTTTLTEGATYTFSYYTSFSTYSLHVSDLVLPSVDQPISFDVVVASKRSDDNGVTTFYDSSEYETSDNVNLTGLDISFTTDIAAAGAEYRRLAVSFEIDGKYRVTMVPESMQCFGKTVTTNRTDGSSHESERMTYRLEIQPDGSKADLYVANADFVAGMPALGEMKFADLDVAYTADGFTFTSPKLIPSIAGVPSPNRLVTDLKVITHLDRLDWPVDITFDCMSVFVVKAYIPGSYFPAD